MAEARVEIAGRSYRVGCETGQEAHVQALGRRIDAETRALAGNPGAIPEARLLVMAALLLADKLTEAEAQIDAAGEGGGATAEIAAQIDALAERLEALAAGTGAAAE
ncbi:MAG: cell division protein ZapA [Pseudomonadota bacterium]